MQPFLPQTPKKFTERLDRVLKERGLNQSALHHALGFAHSTISRWKKGSPPRGATLKLLAGELKVDPRWLAGESDEMMEAEETWEVSGGTARPASFKTVNIVSWAHAGRAVQYEEMPEHFQEDPVPVPANSRSIVAVRVEGDSMEPQYQNGDILCLMGETRPHSGCLVVAKLREDGVLFRRFSILGRDRFRLLPYNELYPATEHREEEFEWICPVEYTLRREWHGG